MRTARAAAGTADDRRVGQGMTRTARRRRMRRVRRKIGGAALPYLGPPFLRLLSSSWKVERLGVEHFERALRAPGRMATMWHGRMLLPLPLHEGKDTRVLVSPSRDGELMNVLLPRFGYGTIRGSSDKSPARAIREMLDGLLAGGWIVITPDGPRGPRHSVNPGAAWMARETGFPIMPCGAVCDRAWRADSWDRFTIPKFGARVAMVYAEPIFVEPDADDEAIREATEEMGRRMIEAEERGFAHLGVERDW